MVNLNPQQLAAVKAPASGVIKISALAGTGKSASILHRTQYLYEQDEGKILLLAFNSSIADELRDRLNDLENKWAVSRTSVYTSYALGYYFVRKYWKTLGLPIFPHVPPDWKLVKDGIEVAKNKGYKLTEPMCKALLAAENWRRSADKKDYTEYCNRSLILKELTNTKKNPKAIPMKELVALSELMYKSRRSKGMIMYMDMISLALELDQSTFDKEDYKHVLIDEAQDVSPSQWRLIDKISDASVSKTIVGDACQALYAFAGADPSVFMGLETKYNTVSYNLDINYRSTQPILDLANKLLELPQLDTTLKLQPNIAKPGLTPYLCNSQEDIAFWVQSLLDKGIKHSDISIIFRARAHTLELETFLAKAGILYRCTSGSFFEHNVLNDILAYYRLFLTSEPTYDDWKTVARHRSRFLSDELLTTAFDENPLAPWEAWSKVKFKTDSQKAIFRGVKRELAALKSIIKTCDPGIFLADLQGEYLNYKWAEDCADDPDLEQEYQMMIQATKDWFNAFRTGQDLLEEYLKRPKASTSDEGVLVTSTHKAKGLEWDYVSIWNVGSGTFPLKEEPEEYRLLYVAVTRAKKELAVFTSKADSTGGILGLLTGDPIEELRSLWGR